MAAATDLYLVNPRSESFDIGVFGQCGMQRARYQADLSITTVAALAPPELGVALCDESVQGVDLDTSAPYVGITCRMSNHARVAELARAFHARGKVVILGGPQVTSAPELLRSVGDVIVRGELEPIADEFFADLIAGQLKSEYRGGRADLSNTVAPRWDGYPHERALMGAIQTSRGCPFECEFCDVPVFLGRKQRFKSTDQILHELQALYELGYRSVSIVDDNFSVNRGRAKDVLRAIAAWNHALPGGAVAFSAMFSMDATRDLELLQLSAEAGMAYVFVGIETSNVESLREAKKRQNLGVDIPSRMRRFTQHGIMPAGGLIVGFDSDGPDVFETQFEFAMRSGIPVFGVSVLTAVPGAPLRARLMAENRLIPDPELATEIVPAQFSRQTLEEGYRWLADRLYRPQNFGKRLLDFIAEYRPNPGAPVFSTQSQLRQVEVEATYGVVDRMLASGPAEAAMARSIWKALRSKPEAEPVVRMALFEYARLHGVHPGLSAAR